MGRRILPKRRERRAVQASKIQDVERGSDFRVSDPTQRNDKHNNDCRAERAIKKGPARGLSFKRPGALCRAYGPAERQQSRADGRHQPEYSAGQKRQQ